MTPPPLNHRTHRETLLHPTKARHNPAPDLTGAAEEQGPLIRQPVAAARLARILHRSATDLWDVCTLTDAPQMWEEARMIASRILAACPAD